MTEGTSLNDILADEPVADVVEDTAPEPRPRDEHGRFAAKGVEEPAEPQGDADPVPPTDKLPKEDYKAIREEREKRQALEKELEALRNQIQQQQEPPAPPPSVWEDEQAWGAHLQQQAVGQASLNARLDMSEMLASQAHEDFDEMKDRFVQMMQANPALQQQALEAKHPWEKAYQIAKNAKAAEELGAVDVNDLREKLKAELLAEMQGSAPVASIPASLSGERSVAPRSGPAWTGPRPLTDLLR